MDSEKYCYYGSNYKFLMCKYVINENNIKGNWNIKCLNESDVSRTGV